jgi:hypothetical protein
MRVIVALFVCTHRRDSNEPSSARRCGSSAVTFGNPIYQLAEAAMKVSIKDLCDAAITHFRHDLRNPRNLPRIYSEAFVYQF